MTQVDQSSDKPAAREWLYDIERLKGLAIMLVVWGHPYNVDFPESALSLRRAIYAFHMPLFMFLSGYVFIYTGSHLLKGGFATYTAKRIKRILLPYFVMAAIILLGKLAFQHIMSVGKPVSSVGLSIERLFINTELNPVFFIWYLAVLFILNIVTAVLYKKLNIKIFYIFIGSLLGYVFYIYCFNTGIKLDYFYFNRVLMNYPAFAAGCLACIYRDQWQRFVDRFWIPCMIVFLVLEYVFFQSEWRYLFVGFASAPAFHGLIRSRFLNSNRFLLFVGTYAFAIYLLNMPFVGLVQGATAPFLSPEENGYAIIVLATLAGITGPIVVRMILNRFARTRPIADAMA